MLALPAAVPAADETGDCVQAFVDESMVLPDGSQHPPGTIRICLEMRYSPVAGLHKTSIDGRTIGLFQSRHRLSEGIAEDPTAKLVFRRIPDGGLTLLGYAIPVHERTALYWMGDAGGTGRRGERAPAGPDLAGRIGDGTGSIRLVPAAMR
jgi:hypothetical protein